MTLNELRQEKEYGYENPRLEIDYKKIKIDPQYIIDLSKKYPNDNDLGREVRKYIIHLQNLWKMNK